MGVLVLAKSYLKRRQLLVPGWLQYEKRDLNEGWERVTMRSRALPKALPSGSSQAIAGAAPRH